MIVGSPNTAYQLGLARKGVARDKQRRAALGLAQPP